jgi:hypothetical protein
MILGDEPPLFGGGSITSSMSIGELWPNIDKLDKISRKGTSARNFSRVYFVKRDPCCQLIKLMNM